MPHSRAGPRLAARSACRLASSRPAAASSFSAWSRRRRRPPRPSGAIGDRPIGLGPGLVDDERPLVGAKTPIKGKGTGAIRTSPPSTAGVPGRSGCFVSGRASSPRMKRYVGRSRKSSKARGRPALTAIRLARHAVDPDVIRLEERAEAVVIDLRDRVELVVVAAGALDRHARGTRGTCARPYWPARRCG